jgi:pyrroloquinoline quinone biosynthesis protein E
MKWGIIAKSVPAIVRARFGGRVPLRVSHCVTYRCNLDCSYCSRHTPTPDELTTAQAKGLMDSFRGAGCLFWSFNGGEPLARADLGELISHAKGLGMFVSVATNGTLVAGRLEQIRRADLVNISLDGPKDMQDGLRGDSYDGILQGVEALQSAGLARSLTTVVGIHNHDRLGEVLEIAEGWGAKAFFQPISVQKEDLSAKAAQFFPTPAQMAAAMDRLLAAKKQGRPVANSARYLRFIRDCWPDKMPAARCWAGRIFCFVDPQGRLAACCDTLAVDSKNPALDTVGDGAAAFGRIPRHDCATCYSAIPLETNILMNAVANPIAMVGELLAGHHGFRWR